MTVTVENSPSAGPVEDQTVALSAEPGPVVPDQARSELVEEDLLVEDVSIDGMCGVY
jgi:mycofactocin precursor